MSAPSDSRLLLIETSGRVGQVGLAEGMTLRQHRRLDAQRRHARDLAPAVKEMLEAAGWRPRDIHAVAVSRGPGSYTGLRVGIMSAKALAYAAGCRILAVDTFLAIALQARPGSDLDVIADAQQERLYVQRFRCPALESPTALSPLGVVAVADWLAALTPDLRVTGPALTIHRARLPQNTTVVREGDWEPHIESLHRLALERLTRDEADDLWHVEPLYARPSSAEEKWAQLGRA